MEKEDYELRRNGGKIPSIAVYGENILEAWEKALVEIWDFGTSIKTKYDNPKDPPSYDSLVMMTIDNPFAQPRVPRNLPDGLEGLAIYTAEVVQGIHDDKVDKTGKSTMWPYSYHQRLSTYESCDKDGEALLSRAKLLDYLNKNPTTDEIRNALGKGEFDYPIVDQVEWMIKKFTEKDPITGKKDPFHKRIQATTWKPTFDEDSESAPCLQRVQPRLAIDEEGDLVLNLHTHWRSRDVYKAVPENVIAYTEWQLQLANEISRRLSEEAGKKVPVKVGKYVDISDSLHIYGKYFEAARDYVAKIRNDIGNPARGYNTLEDEAYIEQTMETKYLIMLDKDYNLRPGNEKPRIKDNWTSETKQCSIILPNEEILICKDNKIFRQNGEIYKENDMKWFWD